MTFGISNALLAQEENQSAQPAQTEQVVETVQTNPLAAPATDATFHEVLKKQFIDGGWEFMSIILLILVLGLAVSIERIIYLTLSTTNTKKLLAQLEETLNKG
ncbi:MAG: flagellar motor protein MotA, partial [Bacteroidetes bacterium]|nr:flagellar motor protein MotA [Bacteroidota bacterium]